MKNNALNRFYLRFLYYIIEVIYASFLRLFRNIQKYPIINYEDIEKIKQIERVTYPKEFLTYSAISLTL